MKILLIEDTRDHADLIRGHLSRVGSDYVEMEWVDLLSKGLDRLAHDRFDAVLLDLTLPDSEPKETVLRVSASAGDTPIIVLTSLDNEALSLAAVQQGAQDYLCKIKLSADLLFRSIRYAIERKRLEVKIRDAAQAANKAKSDFLANVSHEIRTPLGAMIGFADLLLEPGISAEERLQYATTIRTSGWQLSSLLDDVLDLSKVEAGQLKIEKVPCSLIDLISEIRTLFMSQAKKKGLGLSFTPVGPIPETIESDSLRLRQILLNLIGNAIKFTDKGSVTVTIEYIKPDSPRQSGILTFFVKDTGIGLTPQQQKQLCQPFVQADASISRRFGGTGLGLALSNRLASALGGNLRLVKSAPNEGSTFAFRIETGELDNVRFVTTIEQPKCRPNIIMRDDKQNENLAGYKVLLVEDTAIFQTLISYYLKAAGAVVETAHDGIEGVRKALEGEYDVILMDIQMPHMDGYEATSSLRSKGYQKPIIALTAHAMKEERERSITAGCNGHITKPITRRELLDAIMDLTGKRGNIHAGAAAKV